MGSGKAGRAWVTARRKRKLFLFSPKFLSQLTKINAESLDWFSYRSVLLHKFMIFAFQKNIEYLNRIKYILIWLSHFSFIALPPKSTFIIGGKEDLLSKFSSSFFYTVERRATKEFQSKSHFLPPYFRRRESKIFTFEKFWGNGIGQVVFLPPLLGEKVTIWK